MPSKNEQSGRVHKQSERKVHTKLKLPDADPTPAELLAYETFNFLERLRVTKDSMNDFVRYFDDILDCFLEPESDVLVPEISDYVKDRLKGIQKVLEELDSVINTDPGRQDAHHQLLRSGRTRVVERYLVLKRVLPEIFPQFAELFQFDAQIESKDYWIAAQAKIGERALEAYKAILEEEKFQNEQRKKESKHRKRR